MALATSNVGENEKIKVTIKQLDGETFNVEVMKDASVLGLKTMIFQIRNITIDRQRLIYRAQELRDPEALLSQYGVVNDSLLHIVIRPIGNDNVPINNNIVVNIPNPQQGDEGYNMENANDIPMHAIPQNIEIFKLVRLCRFIKIMAITNAVFLCIFALDIPYLFIVSLLSIAGYLGAKYLKRGYLVLYLMCLVLDVCFRIYIICIYWKVVYFILFLSLMVIIDLFLFKLTIQLFRTIPTLSDEVKDQIVQFNRLGLC